MPLVGDFQAWTECAFIAKKCNFENQNYSSRYQPRIIREGLPPTEPSFTSPGRLKIEQKKQIQNFKL